MGKRNFIWGHDRPFNTYPEHFKKLFGERIQKLSIDMGFTCPNRDGTLAHGGCTYCNNDAFNPSYCNPTKSVTQQLNEGIEFHQKRYRRAGKYLAYFQTYSNTYAPIEDLKKIYDEALSHPQIIGLVIGTRPDCIDDEKLKYFAELSKKYYIIIEFGIESCYNKTLEKINRQHTFEQSKDAIIKTASYGIKVGTHLIFGLPGESRLDMLDQVKILNQLPINNIKFHQLQIIRGTHMAKDYIANPKEFNLFELQEYLDFIIKFVSQLNPEFIIERFAGEVPPKYKIAPEWGLIRNDQITKMVEKKLLDNNFWQGKFFIKIKFK